MDAIYRDAQASKGSCDTVTVVPRADNNARHRYRYVHLLFSGGNIGSIDLDRYLSQRAGKPVISDNSIFNDLAVLEEVYTIQIINMFQDELKIPLLTRRAEIRGAFSILDRIDRSRPPTIYKS